MIVNTRKGLAKWTKSKDGRSNSILIGGFDLEKMSKPFHKQSDAQWARQFIIGVNKAANIWKAKAVATALERVAKLADNHVTGHTCFVAKKLATKIRELAKTIGQERKNGK